MHFECYLHDEVPEEEPHTDVVTDTDVVPETDVVHGGQAGSMRNVFDLFSEQIHEEKFTFIFCMNCEVVEIGSAVVNNYPLYCLTVLFAKFPRKCI